MHQSLRRQPPRLRLTKRRKTEQERSSRSPRTKRLVQCTRISTGQTNEFHSAYAEGCDFGQAAQVPSASVFEMHRLWDGRSIPPVHLIRFVLCKNFLLSHVVFNPKSQKSKVKSERSSANPTVWEYERTDKKSCLTKFASRTLPGRRSYGRGHQERRGFRRRFRRRFIGVRCGAPEIPFDFRCNSEEPD